MKREWGRGGRKIMQFNPGETEEIEKKVRERERRKQSYEISWKKKKRKNRGEMRIEWRGKKQRRGENGG